MTLRSMIKLLPFAFALIGIVASEASAQTYRAVPANFVGTAAQCSPAPAGSRIVTSRWDNGQGLPDSGGPHPAGNNAHQGLLLQKNGPTSDCSAATATITIGGSAVFPSGFTINTLGFDFRNGLSCGAGAPRFNVYSGSTTYFFGCFAGTKSAAPQDPAQWTRVTFNAAGGPYAGAETFVFGVTPVDGIDIIFDEGTDTALPDFPGGPGLVTLDNIRINNTFIRRAAGNPFTP
jgi:hypothetical protein